ncbi:MAG: hypothetical protein QOJ99_1180 [Bryobacterales bacterium]|jgi:hypothetical protein|nr:hypothetical protein [Bryobacterales bacterium]
MTTELTDALRAVLDLQHQWTAVKTPAMDARGELIRNRIPNLLRSLADECHFEVYGSAGAGSNNRVPWVRIFNPDFSPSPQEGWYVVILFSTDGSAVYISLIQGTTDWAKGRGARRDPAVLLARSELARSLLRKSGLSVNGLLDNVQLNDPDLGKGYETGNRICDRVPFGRGSGR